jgi:redox-sensitive bicupin YhaK (pirin superfamily)
MPKPSDARLEPIVPRTRDLGGGFTVRRVLPAVPTPSVGPFVFFDHFGPVTTRPGDDHDVRPHPHIGLATVTYLFEGAIQHHDSTGAAQRIEPGAVNWMTAGRGIVHSERAPAALRGTTFVRHGLQLWTALPAEHEEAAPRFEHTPAERIPVHSANGVEARVAVGAAYGLRSPVATSSPTLLIDHQVAAGASVVLPAATEAAERAIYGVDGDFELLTDAGAVQRIAAQTLVVLPPGPVFMLRATQAPARVILLGGEPLGHRFLWWNFVSTSKERIRAAADAWAADAMGRVPGETERIPLPEKRPD